MFTLELIAFNIQSCIAIQKSGAHRIELCDNPSEGGTTPSFGLIEAARKQTSIDLFPIIRPRGGDFFYSEEEYHIMLRDIEICKSLGCDGIVTGMIHKDGSIPKKEISKMVSTAYPMSVSFHRAFDRAKNHEQAIADIIETGCDRILTSGGYATAMEGVENMAAWIRKFGHAITLMPGSGIRAKNLQDILQQTGAKEFHSSARILQASKMEYHNEHFPENLEHAGIDEEEISRMLTILQDNS